MEYHVREATAADEPCLWLMLYAAAHMEEASQSLADVKQPPELTRYVEGWGRSGDVGCLAVVHPHGEPVSATWVRCVTRDAAGYGHLNDERPEFVIGTVKEHRDRGAGTQAPRHLIACCHTRYAGMSLSVPADNPVVRLYERLGFPKVVRTERVNRVGTTSYTMLLSWRSARSHQGSTKRFTGLSCTCRRRTNSHAELMRQPLVCDEASPTAGMPHAVRHPPWPVASGPVGYLRHVDLPT